MPRQPDAPFTWSQWIEDKTGKPTRYFYQLILDLWRRVNDIESSNQADVHTAQIAALRKEISGLNNDFYLEVAKGNVPGHSIVNKFGRNDAIQNASTFEAIWNGGGAYTGHDATVAETLECFAGNTEDAGTVLSSGTLTGGSTTTLIDTGATFSSDGVAAGDVCINDTQSDHGIVVSLTGETQINVLRMNVGTTNASGDTYRIVTKASTGSPVLKLKNLLRTGFANSTTEYIVLNGTNAVDTVGTYLRCSRGRCHGEVNTNAITVRQKTTTANVMMVLPIGYGSTMIAADTIPAGKTGYIIRVFASLSGKTNADAVVRWKVREVNDSFQTQEEFALQGNGTTFAERNYDTPKGPYQEMSDIFVEASADTNSTGVSAAWSILYVDDGF